MPRRIFEMLRGSFLYLLVLVGVIRLALILPWSLDEFTYAHAAWLISQGGVPYRDFALQHPPLSELVGAPFFLLIDESVTALLAIRLMLAFFFVWVVSVLGRLSKSPEPVMFLALALFPTWMLELRPDSIAVGLAVFALYLARKGSYVLAGSILGLALFSSEKVLIYGGSIPLSLLFARGKSAWTVCLSGALTTLLLYFSLILFTGWEPFKLFFIDWTLAHEAAYDAGGVLSYYRLELSLLLLLVLWGIRRGAALDIVLFCLLGILSYLIQKGPHAYSLLPALAPAVVIIAGALPPRFPSNWLTFTLSLSYLLYPFEETNHSQRKLLEEVERFVPKSACVYDNTGIAVNRPHLLFYFYTDSLMRKLMRGYHEALVIEALAKNPCPAMVKDERFYQLPKGLRDRLTEIYPSCSGRLCFAGDNLDAP